MPSVEDPFLTTPRIGVSIVERKLRLAEAVELALRNNLDIEIQRTDRASADQLIRAAQGAFDPVFRFSPALERRSTPVANPLFALDGNLRENFFNWNSGLQARLPWNGASAGVDFINGRQTTNNTFVALNPFFSSQLLFTYRQPLMRNRETDRERSEILIRRKRADVSDVDLQLRVIDVVNRVEQTYWTLAAIRQDVLVEAEAVKLAREQLARTERMIQSGAMAPVELSASRAELERRGDAFYAAVQQWNDVENALKNLIAPGRENEIWSEQLVPVDTRAQTTTEIGSLREMLAEALEKRPELKQIALRQETNQLEQRRDRNQLKPGLNLVAGYANSGLAGSERAGENFFTAQNAALYARINQLSAIAGIPPLPPPAALPTPANLVGSYGQTLSNVFAGNFQTVQVGVEVDWNIRNRTAEANLALASIAERRLKLERARLEQQIEADVRGSLQAIETARQRIQAARAFETAALERLESETRLFQAGESTNFFVLQRQRDYLDARRSAVVAELEYNRAIGRLGLAAGRTLNTYNITVR